MDLGAILGLVSLVVTLVGRKNVYKLLGVLGGSFSQWRLKKLKSHLCKTERTISDPNYLMSFLIVRLGNMLIFGVLAVVELVLQDGEPSLVYFVMCAGLGAFMGSILAVTDVVRKPEKQVAKLQAKIDQLSAKLN